MNSYDVIVVGGGAAGLCCAIQTKRANKKLNILIIEALERVGKKLALTGNGQCNISNANYTLENYHSENPNFFATALGEFDFAATTDFFQSLGVMLFQKEDGKVYPYSLQASSVVDALRLETMAQGITTMCGQKVKDFKQNKNGYTVFTENDTFICKKIVFATGLLSGGEKVGSDGSGFKLLTNKGLPSIKTTPAIVQLRTETDFVRSLKGVKTDAVATLKINGKFISQEKGEVLFTDYGLSGPAIMQLSGNCFKNKGEAVVYLDFMPQYNYSFLVELLLKRFKAFSYRNGDVFFAGMLQNRLGQMLLKSIGLPIGKPVGIPDAKAIKTLADKIKNCPFKVTGNMGFLHSQVTSGGLDTNSFEKSTFECKSFKGLYAIGELLDVDGDCGGYNLQWAWASASLAAKHIAEVIQC